MNQVIQTNTESASNFSKIEAREIANIKAQEEFEEHLAQSWKYLFPIFDEENEKREKRLISRCERWARAAKEAAN